MKHPLKFSILIFGYVVFNTINCFAQQQSFMFTPFIDSVSEYIINNPSDYSARKSLIDAYIQSVNPELAMLEVLDIEEGKMSDALLEIRGLIEFDLEELETSQKTLQLAYLSSPSDNILFHLALIQIAQGNSLDGQRLIHRLYDRIPNVSTTQIGRAHV